VWVPSTTNIVSTSNIAVQLFEQAFQQNFRSKMVTLRIRKFALIVSPQFLCAMNRKPTLGFGEDIEIHDQDLRLFDALCAKKTGDYAGR
jgi:hypothetical protein